MMRAIGFVGSFFVALLLSACGGNQHFRATTAGETTSAPPYLELRAARSAGTLHFPPGIYVLNAVDDKGYYYRSPQRIAEHSFSRGISYDGGIFAEKRNRRKLRGYVIAPYGLTHVGNLSGADYEFRY
ncbi:MAG: hypothetical protein QOH88_2722 [Verrucomicrobiota bacterium]|jgi:hypothetical protein